MALSWLLPRAVFYCEVQKFIFYKMTGNIMFLDRKQEDKEY